METKRSYKALAWILSICLVITLIPELGFAASTGAGSAKTPAISPDEVTEENVVESKKTTDTTTYDLGGGQEMTVFHGGEVRYENEKGELVDYDPSLVKIQDGEKTDQDQNLDEYAYENKEGDKKQYIPQTLSEKTPILMEYKDYRIGFAPTDKTLKQSGAGKEPVEIKKEKIPTTYEQEEKLPINAVYGDQEATLTYTSGEHGIKETLTLEKKPENNVFQYRLQLKGMTARKNVTDQGITLYDQESGDIVGDISAPWMNDASGDAFSEAITYQLKKDGDKEGQYLLSMTIDEAYLSDPQRQYPVTVDPSTTWTGSSKVKDAYIISGSYKNTNFYESGTKVMPAGKNSTGTHRTCIQFTDIKKTIKGRTVTSAKLTVYETGTGASKQKVGAHRIKESWSPGSVTWTKRPSFVSTAYSTITTKKTAKTAHTFNLLSYGQSLANDSIPSYGIILNNNTASPSYACFYGSRHATSGYRPKLVVTHYKVPNAPSVSLSTSGSNTGTGLSFSHSGMDMTDVKSVQYKIQRYNGSAYADYTSGAANQTGSTGLPALPDGIYRVLVWGVNKGDAAGSAGYSGSLTVDKTPPAIGSISLSPSTKENPGPSSPLLSWSGVSDTHLKEIDYSVNDGPYKKAGAGASGSYTIPKNDFSKTGVQTIRVKAVDTFGNTTIKTISDYYVCLEGPELGTVKLTDRSGKNLSDSDWTTEENPTVYFEHVQDKNVKLTERNVSYALVKKNATPVASDYKAPANLVFEEEGGVYNGSFQLTTEDQAKRGDAYNCYVRFTNSIGNYGEKVLSYNKDQDSPFGAVQVMDITGTTSLETLTDTVQIIGKIGDKIKVVKGETEPTVSKIKESSIKLFRKDPVDGNTEEKQVAIIYQDNSTAENTLRFWQGSGSEAPSGVGRPQSVGGESFDLTEYEAMESVVRSFDTTKYANGTYILRLSAEDNAGNSVTDEKSIKIKNPIPAPKIEARENGDKTWTLTWKWKKADDLKEVQYRIGKEGNWTGIPQSAVLEGSAQIQLPEEEGTYTLFVRGMDAAAVPGAESEKICVQDRTAPSAELSEFVSGKLIGTAKDTHLASWTVEIKEKDSQEAEYQKVLEGKKQVENDELGFIDLSGKNYQEGKRYILRLEVLDTTGNKQIATKEITRKEDELTARLEKPQFRIKRPDYQSYQQTTVVFPTNLTKMELQAESGIMLDEAKTDWYADGQKKGTGLTWSADFSAGEGTSFQAEQNYPVLVVSKNDQEQDIYSAPVIRNGEVRELSFLNVTPENGIFTKELELSQPVVALRIEGDEQTAEGGALHYSIQLNNGDFKQVQPGRSYMIRELDQTSVYANKLTVRVTAPEGVETLRNVTMVADSLQMENFCLSSAENYRPTELSAKDQVNYKTYLKWALQSGAETVPENVTFEVYRSTKDGFTPGADTLAAADVKGQSFAEINMNYSKKFYYRVRAVEKKADGQIYYSSFSEQAYGRVVDADESLKRLGIKEYWSYAKMGTPNGTAAIEKSEGNLTYQQTDASLANEKLVVTLDRTYNSRATVKSAFGMGWSHTYDMELLKLNQGSQLDDSLVLRYGDGTMYQFVKQGDAYISSLGKYISLTEDPKSQQISFSKRGVGTADSDEQETVTVSRQYIIKTKEKEEYWFNESGQLVYMTEPNGSFLLFTYDQKKGLLTKVTTNRNLSMEFVYNNKGGQDPLTIKEVRLPDGSRYEYEYVGNTSHENTKLLKVTHKGNDGSAIVYQYDYDNAEIPNLNKIIDAEGNAYTVEYDQEEDRALSISDPQDKMIKLTYSADGYETKTETFIKPAPFSEEEVVASELDRFDGFYGNCMEHIDADGVKTTYTYNKNLLEKTTSQLEYQTVNPESKNVTFEQTEKTEITKYDKDENIASEKTVGQNETKYTYTDGSGGENQKDLVKKETTVNSDNIKTADITYDYDAYGNEIYQFDDVTDEEYDADYYDEEDEEVDAGALAGELRSEIEKEQGKVVSKTTYEYQYTEDGSKTQTAITTCDGITTKTITKTDAMGRELLTETIAGGKTTSKVENTYDGFGRLVRTVTTEGDQVTTTRTSYNANGTVISETDGDGTTTTYAYDTVNRVTSKTVAKGGMEKTWDTNYYYADCQVQNGSDAVTVENAFVTEETDPDGFITSKTFVDPVGRTVKEKSRGSYTDMTYSKQGSLLTSFEYGSDPQSGSLTLNLYDRNGNQTHTALEPALQDGTYNLGGACIVKESAYDSEGNMTASIDAEGNRVKFLYNAENQLTEVHQPGSAITKFAYEKGLEDGASKVTTIDARGNQSSILTNARGLEESIIDYLDASAEGMKRTYVYDEQGNKVKETELAGNYRTYAYDGKNRLTQTRYYDTAGTESLRTEYTYNAADQIIEMKDYHVSGETVTLYRTTSYTYDALKRMTGYSEKDDSRSGASAHTVSYFYDMDNNLTKIDYTGGSSQVSGLTFAYTADKWLKEIKAMKKGGGMETLREYDYDDRGRASEIKDYYAFLDSRDHIKRTYEYDTFGRVTTMTYQDSKKEHVKESYTYTYDQNSNILSERMVSQYLTDDSGAAMDRTREYTYDARGQLLKTVETDNVQGGQSKTTATYTYDKVGNRLSEVKDGQSTAYTYNGLKQLTKSQTKQSEAVTADRTYTYDKNGNQISETDSATQIANTMTYDADNRLSKFVKKEGGNVVLTQENQYNGEGQRIQKKETKGEKTEVRNYYYQDGAVLYTTDEADRQTSMNLMGTSSNVIATSRGTGSNENWYLYNKDIRESTSSLVDSTGAVATAYVYDDFGNTEVKVGADFDNELCYTGQVMDKNTGLYYYNARFYDPENGRFLSQDTYRGEQNEPETYHLYAYCANNPINYVDPSGHFVWKIVGAVTVGTTAYKLGKKYGLKGWKLALCTAVGAGIGGLVGRLVTPLLKPVMHVFINWGKAAGATSKVGKFKIMFHWKHHGKGYHVVLQRYKVTRWRTVFEKGFKRRK